MCCPSIEMNREVGRKYYRKDRKENQVSVLLQVRTPEMLGDGQFESEFAAVLIVL